MATKKLKMNKPVNAKYFYENGEVCDTGVHMGLGQVRRAGIVHTDGATRVYTYNELMVMRERTGEGKRTLGD